MRTGDFYSKSKIGDLRLVYDDYWMKFSILYLSCGLEKGMENSGVAVQYADVYMWGSISWLSRLKLWTIGVCYVWAVNESVFVRYGVRMAATIRNLKIKTSTCKRIVKELDSYKKEVEREAAKTASMKDAGADPYDIKQQVWDFYVFFICGNFLYSQNLLCPLCRKYN